MKPTTRIIPCGDLRFHTESFGDPGDPALLMIMGATASMLWWPEDLCRALAAAGRFVIRYDNRDTGQSSTAAPGVPAYGMDDMARDALGILDGYGLERAHLAGMSLGGMIAQIAALMQPGRVQSLTLISTSAFDEEGADLPPMDPALLAHFGGMAALDWADRAAVIAFQAETARISAGGANFDLEAARDLAAREFDRALNPQSALNHAMMAGDTAWAGRLGDLALPVLVIHGRHDPVLSLAHGRRLADRIAGARMLELDAGHELHPRDHAGIVAAIIDHTG